MPSAQECTDSSIGITRYTNLLFVNKLGNSPTVNSLKGTLTAITNRLGMPLGIISKTIHQAVIISELEKVYQRKNLPKDTDIRQSVQFPILELHTFYKINFYKETAHTLYKGTQYFDVSCAGLQIH